MEKQLTIIEFSIITISQKHSEIMHLIGENKSERISDALMDLMEIMTEIENEYNNQFDNGGDILQGDVLPVSQD